VQRIPLEHAVFDLHFSPRDPSLFAVALSTAAISLYHVEGSTGDQSSISSPSITFIRSICVHDDSSQLALYLAWIPPCPASEQHTASEQPPDGFAVSFSGGQISVFHTNAPSHELTGDSMSEIQLPGSEIEVWFVAFSSATYPDHALPSLFSGDDLSQVREFAFPGQFLGASEDDNPVAPYQKFNDRGKNHGAGVTAILPLGVHDSATVLLTGSYDGHVRVYQPQARGRVLAERDLGGGVWRLQLIHTKEMPLSSSEPDQGAGMTYFILASCMHAGCRIVELSRTSSGAEDGDTWRFDVRAEFTEHTSMNYASGFRMLENDQSLDLLCVSSSFYDKRLCVWRADIPTQYQDKSID
jgi:diphthamide biosynthesis protein 7